MRSESGEYEVLEWIESFGATKFTIPDSGFFGRTNYTLRFDFMPLRLLNYGSLFSTELGSLWFQGGFDELGRVYYRYATGSSSPMMWSTAKMSTDTRAVVEFVKGNGTHLLTVDGVESTFISATIDNDVCPILEFSYTATYGVAITAGTFAADFIPARRLSDGEVGMYDTVSQTFFTNQGTGAFIPGPATGRFL